MVERVVWSINIQEEIWKELFETLIIGEGSWDVCSVKAFAGVSQPLRNRRATVVQPLLQPLRNRRATVTQRYVVVMTANGCTNCNHFIIFFKKIFYITAYVIYYLLYYIILYYIILYGPQCFFYKADSRLAQVL